MVNFVPLSLSDQLNLIHKLQVFTIHGRDKLSRKILRIVGKFVPDQFVSKEALKKYFEDVIVPKLGEKPFSVVYFDTDVESLSVFRSICDLIPSEIRDHNLQTVHFVHSGFTTRLVLSAFGSFFFSGGLHKKINYVNRVDFLWDHMKRTEIEIPKFANDHDEELDFRPVMDYGLIGDHRTVADSSLNLCSLRCTA